MRIVHFSDWHWSLRSLPEADLYVCTGDMYDNYPVFERPRDRLRMDGSFGWRIDPENERQRQLSDTRHFVAEGGFRRFLGSPDAPVVCVRGNHDFIDLAPLFEGCNLVHEFKDNEVVEVLGLRITGHRGIPWIFGSWNDETDRTELLHRVDRMPEADLFLTHYAPKDVLDYETMARGRIESYGLDGMAEEIERKLAESERRMDAVHLFGHIHGCGSQKKYRYFRDGWQVLYSNAACGVNEIDLEVNR